MEKTALPPHVLIFPFPLQGHVNSMLKLAELLCLAGIHVTFIVSADTRDRLLRYTNIQSRFISSPGFQFQTLPDGLPDSHLHSGALIVNFQVSLKAIAKPFLRELLVSDRFSHTGRGPVTCIIADGVMSFALDVAADIGIPVIYFRTISACSMWSYFCIQELIEARELPFSGNDLNVPIKNVPGMEGFLRRRDLPSFCRGDDMAANDLQMILIETRQTPRAHALILNTFEELEGPILSHMRKRMPNIYTIGPLNLHLKTRLAAKTLSASVSSNSLWEEDRSCMRWLDEQPLKSVIYVSFGSLAIMTRDQVMEFWHGLVNSGKRFLWVIRPDSLAAGEDGERQIPTEMLESEIDRAHIVGWAPQVEVLAHPAVGGFLTHSGWNSTLESIVEGVPMLCWPYFGDQQVNSRYVGEVWKLGLDMKDNCDRATVEKMVKDLMEVRRDEFIRSADQMAKLAATSVSEGGQSYRHLDRLIEDIRSGRL